MPHFITPLIRNTVEEKDGDGVKVRAGMILRALQAKHTEKNVPDAFFAGVKNGPTHAARSGELLILDAVAIKKSWANPLITGYEVKVIRGDFVRDEKWHAYLQYCHQFYFVSPPGVVEPQDLPDGVGLIHYNPEKMTLRTKKKAVYKSIEIPRDMLYYLIISKVDSDKYPFFSSKREYFEEYIRNKKECKRLGWRVSTKMAKDIQELAEGNEELQRKLERTDCYKEELDKIKAVCRDAGIHTYNDWDKELKRALSNGVSDRIVSQIDTLVEQAEKVKKMIRR